MKEGKKIIGSKIAGRGKGNRPRLQNFQRREKREKSCSTDATQRTILNLKIVIL
jgi:hypothetical protein